ncbi:DUF4321 domain-containing protein [Vallitalea pronyensis]|uniref:DUF4321 domain-containing protein n=1 Tax=Vallitalea pronyensis TaxID=1348613 RepID=A0A8J8MKT5_9FIRM|nr:DUF4321 domain-containing protein [Vallitalea pronyensis]QUI23329.1 DUF4321 domain-containing protein [Vallitalea pronyensis]
MSYRRSDKNGWALFLLILAGIVLGSFVGFLVKDIEWLNTWFNFHKAFGMENPVTLDLGVVLLVFQLRFDITVASILGIIAGIFVYRKI